MTSISDVAAHASVSPSTVSRVVNHDPTVPRPVREAVLRAIDELNYRPSLAARSLHTGKTRTIGILTEDLRMPSAICALIAASDVATANDYALLVGNSNSNRDLEIKHLQSLLDRRVDGLLWARMNPYEEHESIIARASETIVVVFGGAESQLPGTMTLRDAPEFATAVGELTDYGHRRVAFVSGTHSQTWKRELVRRTQDAGMEVVDVHIGPPFTPERPLRELFANSPPTAIVVRSDVIGSVMMALRALGLQVPHDVSVLCIGHAAETEMCLPPLSVLDDTPEQHARKALEILFGLIRKDDAVSPRAVHDWQYIRRGSVGAARQA